MKELLIFPNIGRNIYENSISDDISISIVFSMIWSTLCLLMSMNSSESENVESSCVKYEHAYKIFEVFVADKSKFNK